MLQSSRIVTEMADQSPAFDRAEVVKLLDAIDIASLRLLSIQIIDDLDLFRARISAGFDTGNEAQLFFHKILGFSTQFFFPACADVARRALASDLSSREKVNEYRASLGEEIDRAVPELRAFMAELSDAPVDTGTNKRIA
jgi:hypothetical protein